MAKVQTLVALKWLFIPLAWYHDTALFYEDMQGTQVRKMTYIADISNIFIDENGCIFLLIDDSHRLNDDIFLRHYRKRT